MIPVIIGLASAQPGLRTGRRGFFGNASQFERARSAIVKRPAEGSEMDKARVAFFY